MLTAVRFGFDQAGRMCVHVCTVTSQTRQEEGIVDRSGGVVPNTCNQNAPVC